MWPIDVSQVFLAKQKICFMKTNFVNCNMVPVVLNDGTQFPVSGAQAKVTTFFSDFDDDMICRQRYGEIVGLPEPAPNTLYIVSAIVLAACKGLRDDVVAPATTHPDCVRGEKGQVLSVPGFVRN